MLRILAAAALVFSTPQTTTAEELLLEYPSNYSNDGPGIALELLNRCPMADGFDFPVGKPNMRGYYNAQKFRRNKHLGDDLNGVGGGNSDLGDPIYAIGHGIVVSAKTESYRWGEIIRIVHKSGTKENPLFVEAIYAHMQKMFVKPGDIVRRGQQIGTMGDANGNYPAHLHLELRTTINLPIGTGYAEDTKGYSGYVDPSAFISANRPRRFWRKIAKARKHKAEVNLGRNKRQHEY